MIELYGNIIREKEILNEIEKAKQFSPSLKKFYLATTALNDAKLQAFIRQQNIKHIGLGLFEIHLFCWESIVDLIDENRRTHNWYVKNQNYQSNKSVAITFHDGSTELRAKVPFQQTITEFREELPTANMMDIILKQNKMLQKFNFSTPHLYSSKVNHSYFKFNLRISNTGVDPIEEFKVLLNFEGEFLDLETMTKGGGGIISSVANYSYNTFLDKVKKTGKIIPSKKILVGDDIIDFDTIIIKPVHELETDLLINWKVISKDFKDDGQLKLTMLPEIKTNHITELVDDPLKCRIVISEIEDYTTNDKKKY